GASGGGAPRASIRAVGFDERLGAAAAVDRADDGPQRGGEDALVAADAPEDDAVARLRLDVGDGGGAGAGADGVLGVVDHVEIDAEGGLEGGDEGVDRPV